MQEIEMRGIELPLDPLQPVAMHHGAAKQRFGRRRVKLKIIKIRRRIAPAELDPDHAATYDVRALAYRSLGQYEKTAADKYKACSLDSQYC